MNKLATRWLGLDLPSPLVLSASPLSRSPDAVARSVDAGAAAVTLHSLFEEQLTHDQMALHRHIDTRIDLDAESRSVLPEGDLFAVDASPFCREIEALKRRVAVPVIASLNGTTPGGWIAYGRDLVNAGADALELNLYEVATSPDESGAALEERQLAVVRAVVASVAVPVNVKLSPFYGSVPHFVRRLQEAGVQGVTVFNRFYQPDIDPDALAVDRHLALSSPAELSLRLHALAILSPWTTLSLGCTGGVHTGRDIAKAVLSGAHVVHVASVLLQKGPAHVATMLSELSTWLDTLGYRDLNEARGVLNLASAPDAHLWERLNYAQLLDSWRTA